MTRLFAPILLLRAASLCLSFSPRAPSTSVPPRSIGGPRRHRQTRDVLLRPPPALSSSPSDSEGGDPLAFLRGIFSPPAAPAAGEDPEPRLPDVVIDQDYALAAAFAVAGLAIVAADRGVGGVLGGGFVTLLASLFAVQATRLRFVFDEECFELKAVDSMDSKDLADSGENVFVGGANRWTYSSFVNWDFYPSVNVPVLVYFKETQTSADGQIHFFPVIANAKQLEEQFELRGCAKVRKD